MKKTTKRARNSFAFTAYTDRDRGRKLTTEPAILAEYRRLKLPPVTVGELLLSPALVEALQDDEPELHPEVVAPAPEPGP